MILSFVMHIVLIRIKLTSMDTSKDTTLHQSFKALLEGESDWIANLANASAFIHDLWKNHWSGFYLVKGDQLVLGPFQGPVACTRIDFGKGVCGTAWKKKEAIIVDDVEAFPGHIACSPFSKSEIVIPLIHRNEVIAVLDLDSDQLSAYGLDDQISLEKLMSYLIEASAL